MAPLHDFAAINIPRQIDEQSSGREKAAQQAPQVFRRHAIPDEGHALLNPGLEGRLVWLKVKDGDLCGVDAEMFDQNGQRATRHRAKTEKQDFIGKFEHYVLPVCQTELIQVCNREPYGSGVNKGLKMPAG